MNKQQVFMSLPANYPKYYLFVMQMDENDVLIDTYWHNDLVGNMCNFKGRYQSLGAAVAAGRTLVASGFTDPETAVSSFHVVDIESCSIVHTEDSTRAEKIDPFVKKNASAKEVKLEDVELDDKDPLEFTTIVYSKDKKNVRKT